MGIGEGFRKSEGDYKDVVCVLCSLHGREIFTLALVQSRSAKHWALIVTKIALDGKPGLSPADRTPRQGSGSEKNDPLLFASKDCRRVSLKFESASPR
jgi:hypothetical protein